MAELHSPKPVSRKRPHSTRERRSGTTLRRHVSTANFKNIESIDSEEIELKKMLEEVQKKKDFLRESATLRQKKPRAGTTITQPKSPKSPILSPKGPLLSPKSPKQSPKNTKESPKSPKESPKSTPDGQKKVTIETPQPEKPKVTETIEPEIEQWKWDAANEDEKAKRLLDWEQAIIEKEKQFKLWAQLVEQKMSERWETVQRLNAQSMKISLDRLMEIEQFKRDDVIRMQNMVKKWLARHRLRKTVQAFRNSDLSKQMRHRCAAMREIVESEKKYIDSLQILQDKYLTPIQKHLSNDDDVAVIVTDLTQIITLSRKLYKKLSDRFAKWPAVNEFGDIFKKFEKNLWPPYSTYIINFTKVQTKINDLEQKDPNVKTLLENIRIDVGQPFVSFLIMPVQRLPRYEILLKALIEHTVPEHVDYQNLLDAKATIQSCNEKVNSIKREADIKDHVNTVQTRQLKKKQSQGLLLRRKKSASSIGGKSSVGKLKIHVHSAINLKAMDGSGTSDPYVLMSLGEEKSQTKVIKKNLAPDWDEEFVFSVNNTEDIVRIECFDWNLVSSHEIIGKLEFLVRDIKSGNLNGRKADGEQSGAAVALSGGAQWFYLQPVLSYRPTMENSGLGEIKISFVYVVEDTV